MDKIAILTDTCSDLAQHHIKKKPIYIIPLKVVFSDGEYLDGVTIDPKTVYEKQKQEQPKTTLPDGARVLEMFNRIREDGYNKLVVLPFSSGLSGTYNLLRMLAQDAEGIDVCVHDTLNASIGSGLSVLQVAAWIEEGESFDKINARLPGLLANTRVWFCVDTLEYLQKGGRIGKISAITGTMLQIKPIITFAHSGELESIAKVRGKKAAMEKLVEFAMKFVPRGAKFRLAVVHGDTPEEFKTLRGLAMEKLPDHMELVEGEIDSVLAAYVGPRLLGVGVQILDGV